MPVVPEQDELALPGRLVARTGVKAELAGAALISGEVAWLTDIYCGAFGDESQNPPLWPTTKTTGEFDWRNFTPVFNNIKVNQINNQTIKVLVEEAITKGETPVITIINEVLTKTVYGVGADFANFQEAFAWLSQRTISSLGFVVLQLGAGVFSVDRGVVIEHPNGNRIRIQGAPLKRPLPKTTAYQVTGYALSQRNTDTLVNKDLLRRSYATEFQCTNGASFTVRGNISMMQDILITSDGANGPGSQVTVGLLLENGNGVLYRMAVVGFTTTNIQFGSYNVTVGESITALGAVEGTGVAMYGSSMFMQYCEFSVLGNAVFGMSINQSGMAAINYDKIPSYLRSSGNFEHGMVFGDATGGGVIEITSELNKGFGIIVGSSSYEFTKTISRNNGAGSYVFGSLSNATLTNVTAFGPGVGIQASNSSFINITGADTSVQGDAANYSPAPNTFGNRNAYITV